MQEVFESGDDSILAGGAITVRKSHDLYSS